MGKKDIINRRKLFINAGLIVIAVLYFAYFLYSELDQSAYREVMAILVISGILFSMILSFFLGIIAVIGGGFGIWKYILKRRRDSKNIIFNALVWFAVLFAGFYTIYFAITFHSRWNNAILHDNQIDSFAGCGRDNHDSYKYVGEERTKEILKMWDISEKEFEKRKKRCEEKL